ncbi:MAG: GIY-YIG nuclease family protein [Deltaproteobacteria bacterium]
MYLARCADATLYCGITNDLAARLTAHNARKGARYTRSRTPIEIVGVRRCTTKGRALQLEYRVKQLTREQKQRLVATPSSFDAFARKALTVRKRNSDARQDRRAVRHASVRRASRSLISNRAG